MPGGQNNIAALKSTDGNVHVSHKHIAECLCDHWQATFGPKTTDSQLREEWLQDIRDRFKVSVRDLEPSREDVSHVL